MEGPLSEVGAGPGEAAWEAPFPTLNSSQRPGNCAASLARALFTGEHLETGPQM